MLQWTRGWIACAALALLCGSAGLAQTTSQITGRVTDSSQAVIVGAEVVLTNIGTGMKRAASTNEEGYFFFPSLQPGSYSLEVKTSGFKSAVRSGITLSAQQALRIDFALEIGQVAETVLVTAEAPLLQTETGTVATTVGSRAVMDLPLASGVSGRDPVELLQVLPGSTNRGIAGTQSINGGLHGSNDIQVDGISKTEERFGNSSGAGGIPSVDTVSEVKLMTNIYSAEFGRSGGATVIVSTKSGTNQFAGSAYEFFRHAKTAARNFFSPTVPPLRSNQFGGTFSGPIVRNKTFFFSSFEAWYLRTDGSSRITVPTELQRDGDFSQTLNYLGNLVPIYDPLTGRDDPARPGQTIRTAFPGNVIPSSRFDPVGRKIVSYYGLPNYPGQAYTNAQNYWVGDSAGRQFNQTLHHITHHFGSNNVLSGRFFLQQLDQKQPVVFDNIFNPGNNNQHAPNRFVALTDTHVIGPKLVNEARAGLNRHINAFRPQFPGDAHAEIGLKGYPSPAGASPRVTVSGYSALGNLQWLGTHQTVGQFSDTLAYTHGRHSIKIGGDVRRYHFNTWSKANEPGALSFGGGFTNQPGVAQTGNGVADLLLGWPTSGSVSIQPGYGFRSSYFAGFFQDDFKVLPTLTLNLGIRYEYESPPVEVADRMAGFDAAMIEPLTGLPGAIRTVGRGTRRTMVAPDRNNWGPRFGFAWAPRAIPEFSVRGGYGIRYSPATRQTLSLTDGFTATTSFSTLDNRVAPFLLSQGLPYYRTPPDVPSPSFLVGQDASWINPGNVVPYIQQWSFGLEKQVASSLLLDVSYVGNKGARLPRGTSLNRNQLPASLLDPSILTRVPNPFQGKVTGSLDTPTITRSQLLKAFPHYTSVNSLAETRSSSIYHSLQFKAERRLSGGLYFINSYTFSKMLADTSGANLAGIGVGDETVQDAYNLKAERGRTRLDVEHRFVSMFVYELPFGEGRRWIDRGGWLNQLIGGWQLNWIFTAQTGMPLTVVNSNYTYAGGGSRPNRVCDGNLSRSQRTIAKWFDTSCFADQPQFTFGNSGVGILDGPGLWNADLSLFKAFSLTERFALQYRAEAFNAFNHPNFNNPGVNLNSGSFGAISSTQGGNLQPMGGPRMIQMALKLTF